MTTEPEMREYYKLIFPTSIKVGDYLRILEWRDEFVQYRDRKPWKVHPAGMHPVWARVDRIKRFGSSVIVNYSRSGIEKGERRYGTTIYYPRQYACLIVAYCSAQPDSPDVRKPVLVRDQ